MNSTINSEYNAIVNKNTRKLVFFPILYAINKGINIPTNAAANNLSCSNVKIIKLPENNKTDERLLSKETICCLTEKRENSNSSNKAC